MSVYIYKAFDDDTDVLVDQREIVTAPLWSNGQSSLYNIFTSSIQNNTQKEYYYEIYNSQSNAQGAEPQFSILYADSNGSGSSTGSLDRDLFIRPTKTNYLQYSQLLLPIGVDTFTFMDGETTEQSSEYVYIININRSRFKDRIDTKNWQLSLAAVDHTGAVNATASIITLIDDASTTTTELNSLGGRVYNVRSGSIANGVETGDLTPYGLFYPDNGIIVLNGMALDTYLTFGTRRTPATASGEFNHKKLFTSISGAMQRNINTFSFQGRTSEVISSLYYFARLRWDEFNYTNNASFYSTDANTYGQLKHAWMAPAMGTPGHPETFPTTIGLYDDDENLLAVAKVSKAIKKTFDHEIIFKIKLDY
jgi:hypothetical protein